MVERGKQSGVALLVALVTITLVTISVMQFTHSRQVDYRRTAHWLQAKQAQLYADSAIELAKLVLVRDRLTGDVDGLTDLWAAFCRADGIDSCAGAGAVSIPCPLPTLDDLEDASDFESLNPYRSIALRIEDATGLYNLNRLRRRHTIEQERAVARELFMLSEVDPDLIGPIVDWIDSDRAPYAYGAGAEEPQYSEIRPPYAPRNGSLRSFRELALVRGLDARSLVRLRRNAAVLPEDEVESININTAPLTVLRSLRGLDPDMGDEAMLAQLMAERCRQPFTSHEDLLARVSGFPSRVAADRWIRFSSPYFRILASGAVDDVYQSVEALVHRTESEIRVVYYLPRRGAVIPGVDLSVATDPDDLDFTNARRIGAF